MEEGNQYPLEVVNFARNKIRLEEKDLKIPVVKKFKAKTWLLDTKGYRLLPISRILICHRLMFESGKKWTNYTTAIESIRETQELQIVFDGSFF